jgi:L-fucose dehydrogenase
MNLGLDGKVVLVTGGGAGIGGAVSMVLAEEGAIPVILGRSTLDDAFAARIALLQPAYLFVHVDVEDDAACARAGDQHDLAVQPQIHAASADDGKR